MNIFKTFEVFLREPLSILRNAVFQIANINTELEQQPSVSVDIMDKKTQITVVNSDKMYNLLKTVMRKQEENAAKRLYLPPPKGKMVIGQLCKRY